MKLGKPFSIGLLLVACSSCTVVRVEGGELQRYGGTLRLDPQTGASSVTIKTRSFGLLADGNSLLLGYGESRTIIIPQTSRCAAVIIIGKSSEEQLSEWRNYFSRYPEVCVEGGGT